MSKYKEVVVNRERYEQILEELDALVTITLNISAGSANRPSETGKHYYASLLYTNLCNWALGILFNLPNNRFSSSRLKLIPEFWSLPVHASLARGLIECFLGFFYLCVEPKEKDEWELRWNVFNLHDCLRRKKLFEYSNSNSEIKKFENEAKELNNRLQKNTKFLALERHIQKKCLAGEILYLESKKKLMDKIGVDTKFYQAHYMLLSSQLHTHPLGFYRIGEDNRGRGLENDVDRTYICDYTEFSILLLKRAANEMIKTFPDSASKLSKEQHAILTPPN